MTAIDGRTAFVESLLVVSRSFACHVQLLTQLLQLAARLLKRVGIGRFVLLNAFNVSATHLNLLIERLHINDSVVTFQLQFVAS